MFLLFQEDGKESGKIPASPQKPVDLGMMDKSEEPVKPNQGRLVAVVVSVIVTVVLLVVVVVVSIAIFQFI